jgi:hypothetical protein
MQGVLAIRGEWKIREQLLANFIASSRMLLPLITPLSMRRCLDRGNHNTTRPLLHNQRYPLFRSPCILLKFESGVIF